MKVAFVDSFFLVFLNEWIEGVCGDVAQVVAVACDHGEALHAPGGAPAVLDQPVVVAGQCAVADDHDGVIGHARARRVRVHATLVAEIIEKSLNRVF